MWAIVINRYNQINIGYDNSYSIKYMPQSKKCVKIKLSC